MDLDFELLYRFVIAVDILLCAAIIICNLFLLLSILTCKRARRRTRNVMLFSVCVADLLVGAFTHPIYIHSYHTETLFHSCEMHILMQLIGDYSQDFVCFWTLVTLGTVYMYRLAAQRWGWGSSQQTQYGRLSPPSSKCDTFIRFSKKALLVGWPWLGTLLIPIPILMATVEQSTKNAFWDETFCPLHTPFPSRMVVLVLVFYLPMAALLLLCVGLALLMYWDFVHAKRTPGSTSLQYVETAADEEAGRREAANGHLDGNVVYRGGDGTSQGHVPPDQADVSDDASRAALAQDGNADRSSVPRGDSSLQAPESSVHTHDPDPSVTLVEAGGAGREGEGRTGGGRRGRRGRREEESDPVERPVHILVPLLVTVMCALPLMVGWWFYRQMPHNAVIIVSITLSRIYLLRAALLPLAWFTLPELRTAAAQLWDCMSGRRALGSTTSRETGEFSVAYTTLRESRDAPPASSSTGDGEDGRGGERQRQNPFDPDFVRA